MVKAVVIDVRLDADDLVRRRVRGAVVDAELASSAGRVDGERAHVARRVCLGDDVPVVVGHLLDPRGQRERLDGRDEAVGRGCEREVGLLRGLVERRVRRDESEGHGRVRHGGKGVQARDVGPGDVARVDAEVVERAVEVERVRGARADPQRHLARLGHRGHVGELAHLHAVDVQERTRRRRRRDNDHHVVRRAVVEGRLESDRRLAVRREKRAREEEEVEAVAAALRPQRKVARRARHRALGEDVAVVVRQLGHPNAHREAVAEVREGVRRRNHRVRRVLANEAHQRPGAAAAASDDGGRAERADNVGHVRKVRERRLRH
eukprot:Opistho-1_new@23097